MELTFIGMIQVVIGILVVFFGSVRSALIFLLVSALFEGSAAIALPSLGGSSIPPVQFALFFTTLRILAPKGGYVALLPSAIADNKWYVLFAIYGMATAYPSAPIGAYQSRFRTPSILVVREGPQRVPRSWAPPRMLKNGSAWSSASL